MQSLMNDNTAQGRTISLSQPGNVLQHEDYKVSSLCSLSLQLFPHKRIAMTTDILASTIAAHKVIPHPCPIASMSGCPTALPAAANIFLPNALSATSAELRQGKSSTSTVVTRLKTRPEENPMKKSARIWKEIRRSLATLLKLFARIDCNVGRRRRR